MTTEEFIDNYSKQRAEELQAEMLAQSSRRPKKWTIVEKSGESTRTYTINFDGCPFKLKSSGMVDWLRVYLLWMEAEDSLHGFKDDERFVIGIASIIAHIECDLWVLEPIGLVNSLWRWMHTLKNHEEKLNYMMWLKSGLTERFNAGLQSEAIHWNCWQAIMQSCIYIMEIAIEANNTYDATFAAMEQLRVCLDENLNYSKEIGEEPDFSIEAEYFEQLIKLIPKIELCCNKDLNRQVYEFARDYYQATRRYTLADTFSSKLETID